MGYGAIGTDEKCPCGEKFVFKNNRVGFECPQCGRNPKRYRISAKSLDIPQKKYSSRLGVIFSSWDIVWKEWTAMNSAYEECKTKGIKWNPDDWIASKVKLQEFQNKAKNYLDNKTALYDRNKLSRSRYNAITNIVNKFLIPYFTGKDIREITAEQVKEFYYHILDLRDINGEQYSDIYIRDILAELRGMFLEYRQDVPEFPTHTIVPKREKQWLGIERQLAIEPHIPQKYHLPIKVLQFTGMRIGELRALQVKDMVDGALRVWKAFGDDDLRLTRKSGGEVVYQLSYDLWNELKEHTQGFPPDTFIFTLNRKPYGPNCLYRAWKKACREARVKYIPIQQASRHSTASRIMKEHREKALEEIQAKLGHTNRKTGEKNYVVE